MHPTHPQLPPDKSTLDDKRVTSVESRHWDIGWNSTMFGVATLCAFNLVIIESGFSLSLKEGIATTFGHIVGSLMVIPIGALVGLPLWLLIRLLSQSRVSVRPFILVGMFAFLTLGWAGRRYADSILGRNSSQVPRNGDPTEIALSQRKQILSSETRHGQFAFTAEASYDNDFFPPAAAEGLIAVKTGVGERGLWGFIDLKGRTRMYPTFEGVADFSGGLAMVYRRVGTVTNNSAYAFVREAILLKFGFIDLSGTLVIDYQFDTAENFSEGFAMVGYGDPIKGYRRGYIDKAGKMMINPQFGTAQSFHHGVAAVGTWGTPRRYGLIRKDGTYQIEPTFGHIGNFSITVARASPLEGTISQSGRIEDKFGLIDRKGKWVVMPQFDFIGEFSEGAASVRIGDFREGIYGFVDASGKYLINPLYQQVKDFSEGLAAVQLRAEDSGKWGFINLQGQQIIPFHYDDANSFSEGVAAVSLGDSYGLIDKTGKWILAPTFKQVGQCMQGVIAVKVSTNNTPAAWRFMKKL